MSESPKERIPDEDDTTEAPLTMAASVVLTNLPKDTSKALETAGNLTVQKGTAAIVASPSMAWRLQLPNITIAYLHCFCQKLQPTNLSSPIVTIRLHPIGSAPHLTQRIFKLSTNQAFATIVRFLRKRLGVKEHESVFCYVGNVFSPGLDEGVGNLWSCFKQGEELVVGYALAPAFG